MEHSSNKTSVFTDTELTVDSYKALLPSFFEEIIADFEGLKAAFETNDPKGMKELAHKIKGTAASYSARLIHEKARLLQMELDSEHKTKLKNLVEALGVAIARSYEYARVEFGIK